jgi:imidazolonepropionase-like amidohydrolase
MTDLLLVNGSVCDVDQGVLREEDVLVLGDRIAEVGAGLSSSRARVVDLRGRVVLPGLIDSHVHVTAATADLAAQAEWSPAYVSAHAVRTLKNMLGRGFTTVRDVGGADFGLAAAVEEGVIDGPRLVFGGKALSQTGGHADMRGPGRSVHADHVCSPSLGLVCDGVAEVRRAAREQLRTGASHLKLMLSGGIASPTDRIDSTQFSEEEIEAAVQEAAAAGRYVTGHAYTAQAVNRALSLGVRCIEHGNLIDDESIELFRRQGAFLVPTLSAYEFLALEGAQAGLPASQLDKLGVVLEAGLRALELAWRGQVQIAFGTDLLGSLHQYQSHEFRIRAQVQPPAEVLRSATTVGARLLRMEGEIGVVAPGASADLLVVDGNPLEDAGVLSEPAKHVKMLLTRGRVFLDALDQ